MNCTEQILEFDKIKEKLAALACTSQAKKEVQMLKPYLDEASVLAKLRETTMGREMLDRCGNPPLAALQGIAGWIELAEKGGCLNPGQLEEISMALTAVKRWKDYLQKGKAYKNGLAYYEENLDSLEEVQEQLSMKIRNGEVDDYASGELRSLREALARTDDRMHEKADSVLKSNRQYLSDSFSTVKSGHLCIPVKKEYKYKINGTVIDKSSAGNTLFMEPAAVTKLASELEELKIDEEREEEKILYGLSVMVADQAEVISCNNRTIEKLDFIFAKARLSQEYDGMEPEINTERYIKLQNSRHPLMDREKNVPLNFEIGHGINGVIITGPNTGGKTVALKTTALTCIMAQCGLHVPCEKADICMNNAFLCDIGDGQSLTENLSTFSSHITNVLAILKTAGRESLVIMDELGSGTDPAEGMGIAVAVLEELHRSGALFLVTTHYPEVKEYAKHKDGMINARMTFDRESLRPLYRLEIGEAGESCALYIAGRLGMPGEMLQRAAKAAYGNNYVTDKNIVETEEKVTDHSFVKTSAKIKKKKKVVKQEDALVYQIGDSVMVLPDKKIGIVCQTADEKGMLRVQLPDRKIWLSHKRIRLHVAADKLYPADYDFSVLFDSVEKRKARHDMERKYVKDSLFYEE